MKIELDEFLGWEVRHSVGNYVIVDIKTSDLNKIRIITSLSFCGGYITENRDEIIISLLLSNILRSMNADEIKLNNPALIHYLNAKHQYFAPFSTVFNNITKMTECTGTNDTMCINKEKHIPFRFLDSQVLRLPV